MPEFYPILSVVLLDSSANRFGYYKSFASVCMYTVAWILMRLFAELDLVVALVT